MLNLSVKILELFNLFALVFYGETTWEKDKQLLVGAILSSGKRTVTAALRVMGLKETENYAKYHHVLNRAVWSSLDAAKILLGLLKKSLVLANEPIVFGIDETIERRWGQKISAHGIYRDPIRSSNSHFVKTSGLRWMSLMLLAKVSWTKRIWALPVLTALAPSDRYYQVRRHQNKSLIERAKQIIWQIGVPQQALVFVGDSSYAALDFLSACQHLAKPVSFITRLRMDAALYEPAPAYAGKGQPRKRASVCRPLGSSSMPGIKTGKNGNWLGMGDKFGRWKSRPKLLFGVTLASHLLRAGHAILPRQAAWYAKALPTFSDALALVHLQLWDCLTTFLTSGSKFEMIKVPPAFAELLIETLVYAA
jgi:hypothetical protein